MQYTWTAHTNTYTQTSLEKNQQECTVFNAASAASSQPQQALATPRLGRARYAERHERFTHEAGVALHAHACPGLQGSETGSVRIPLRKTSGFRF